MEAQLSIPIVRYVIERQRDLMKDDSWVPVVLPHSRTLAVYVDRGEAEDMLMTAQRNDPYARLRPSIETDAELRARRDRWGCL